MIKKIKITDYQFQIQGGSVHCSKVGFANSSVEGFPIFVRQMYMVPIKPILYSDIREKNILEQKLFRPLSPTESLIHTLNIMDLFASMRARPHHREDDIYPWIILKFKK